jgi:hypothetical protein
LRNLQEGGNYELWLGDWYKASLTGRCLYG